MDTRDYKNYQLIILWLHLISFYYISKSGIQIHFTFITLEIWKSLILSLFTFWTLQNNYLKEERCRTIRYTNLPMTNGNESYQYRK